MGQTTELGTNLFKMKLCQEWMEEDHILIHCDSRTEGVIVPSHLAGDPALTLKLSHLFQGKTELSPQHISSFLKFSGEYFECVIPWEAIWGVTRESGERKVWTDDLPSELASALIADGCQTKTSGTHEEDEEPTREEVRKSCLKRIK